MEAKERMRTRRLRSRMKVAYQSWSAIVSKTPYESQGGRECLSYPSDSLEKDGGTDSAAAIRAATSHQAAEAAAESSMTECLSHAHSMICLRLQRPTCTRHRRFAPENRLPNEISFAELEPPSTLPLTPVAEELPEAGASPLIETAAPAVPSAQPLETSGAMAEDAGGGEALGTKPDPFWLPPELAQPLTQKCAADVQVSQL